MHNPSWTTPQDVTVNAIDSNHTAVLELRVTKEGIGKVQEKAGDIKKVFGK